MASVPAERVTISQQVDALLLRAKTISRAAYRRDLGDLYTTACAELLVLEAEALRIKRLAMEARMDAAHDVHAWREFEQLSARHRRLKVALRADRHQLRHLRTAIEWLQANPD